MIALPASITLPGSLLLFGEYALLEPGGLGIACAVEPRLHIAIERAQGLALIGRMGDGREIRYRPGDALTPDTSYIGRIVEWLAESANHSKHRRLSDIGARIVIDSSSFFDASGRKLGFGSSAALSVGLTAALLHLMYDSEPRRERLLKMALSAHRTAQQGLGSGYDVAASLYGGVGVVLQGTLPRWRPLVPAPFPSLYWFGGSESVSTTEAIKHCRRWQREWPDRWRAFMERSNAAVGAIVGSSGWAEALPHAVSAREAALALGAAIGVPAEIEAPIKHSPSSLVKAIGAGNELGILFGDIADGEIERVEISLDGLRWAAS